MRGKAEASQLVETLRHRGISIPGEVAIASFNDSMDAWGCQPPLTSVRLPFRAMGRRAVEMLIPRISGSEQLEKTWMPLQLVLRRSCGCLEPMAEQAAALETFPSEQALMDTLPLLRSLVLPEMARHMGTSLDALANYWAENLFDIFISEMLHPSGENRDGAASSNYLRDLDEILRQAVAEGSNVSRWHESLTILRQH